MTTYSEWTQQVGDQWVAVIERADAALSQAAQNAAEAAKSYAEHTPKFDLPQYEMPKFDMPKFDVPGVSSEQIAQLAEGYPTAKEVVEANYELTTRVLAAQRELALHVIALNQEATPAAPKAETKPAAKSSAKAAS